MTLGRPSAPHTTVRAVAALQFPHEVPEGAQLQRISSTGIRTLPYSWHQEWASAHARGLPVMWLSADWPVRSRVRTRLSYQTGDQFFSFLRQYRHWRVAWKLVLELLTVRRGADRAWHSCIFLVFGFVSHFHLSILRERLLSQKCPCRVKVPNRSSKGAAPWKQSYLAQVCMHTSTTLGCKVIHNHACYETLLSSIRGKYIKTWFMHISHGFKNALLVFYPKKPIYHLS